MSDAKSDDKTEQSPAAPEGAQDAKAAAEAAQAAEAGVSLESFDEGGGSDAAAGGALSGDPKDREIEQLKSELDQIRDQLMRAAADIQNTRRRAERDRREAEMFGGVKLARDVLGVYDNLAKALDLATSEIRESEPAFIEGLELTRRELVAAFSKHKIERVAPEKGEKFDPNRHEAMFEAPFGEPGTVVEIIQDGFMIADRLLRPAQVGVASASARPAEPAAAAPTAEAAPDGAGDS